MKPPFEAEITRDRGGEKQVSLTPRLLLCASFLRKGASLADIGSDHALLPIYSVINGISKSAIASDINEGPISRARLNIGEYGVSKQVSAVVADGLDALEPDKVDDIVIAGMGGELISYILSRAPWLKNERYRLILQPMTKSEKLREWLWHNGFELAQEKAVLEGKHAYTVLCCRFIGEQSDFDTALLFGGKLLGKTDPASRAYLEREANALGKKAHGLSCVGEHEQARELEAAAKRLLDN